MENNQSFSYTYSAAENTEIKNIRRKYEIKNQELTKLELLRKLDQSVYQTATAVSLVVGIIGTLLFGTGMSFIMVWSDTLFAAGIVIGGIGILVSAFAYPIYQAVLAKKRQKIAPTILSLSDELLGK